MSSNDPRIVANPHVQGGVGVEHRVVEASLEETMLWPLTTVDTFPHSCSPIIPSTRRLPLFFPPIHMSHCARRAAQGAVVMPRALSSGRERAFRVACFEL